LALISIADIKSAAFSAIIRVAALVLAGGIVGMMEGKCCL
jgi:hypothetical protein